MSSKAPLILFYTRWFHRTVEAEILGGTMPANWTRDLRRMPEADAVVFHVPNRDEMGDARKYPGQKWVAWSNESNANYPLLVDPGFMKHFDITMTYEAASDVWMPYLPGAAWWRDLQAGAVLPKTEAAPVVLFQSSNVNLSGRETFIADLSQHIGIDSYGRFMKNRSIDGPDLGPATKIDTIGRYKFCLAFENSIAPDYVTEKLYEPLLAGSVPVYLGAPNAGEFAPENSYIDAAAFKNPQELASYIQHLADTPHAYDAYLAWRSKPLPDYLVGLLARLETPLPQRLTDVVEQRRVTQGSLRSGRPTLPFGYVDSVRTKLRRRRRMRRGEISRL